MVNSSHPALAEDANNFVWAYDFEIYRHVGQNSTKNGVNGLQIFHHSNPENSKMVGAEIGIEAKLQFLIESFRLV